ncbi:MAG: hypothetical protein Q9M27_00130, partial [Mariprofundaceae bacterium]|nr:hypothetical protein [Mariprofundaceae bacterium]
MTDFMHRHTARPILMRALILSALSAATIAALAYVYLQLRVADITDAISVAEAHDVQIQAEILSADLRFIAYALYF